MSLPFPTRTRPQWHYYPIWSTILMLSTIIFISVWIHYTTVLINNGLAALDVLAYEVNADNQMIPTTAVTATSVLFMIYTCVMYGLSLWRAMLEAEVDIQGKVCDKMQLYQMANLGVRICWWIIMLWVVFVFSGFTIMSIYVSNLKFMIETTVENQLSLEASGVRIPDYWVYDYRLCPAYCLDLWVVNYIDTPKEASCICDLPTLQAAYSFLEDGAAAIGGSIAGIVLLYVVGGFWRAELSKQYAAVKKEQDVAARLEAAAGAMGGGARASTAAHAGAARRGGANR